MNDIVSELGEKNLNNITKKEVWKCNCKKCGEETNYSYKQSINRFVKNGQLCRKCAHKGKIKTDSHKRKISKSHTGFKLSEQTKQKIKDTRLKKGIKPVCGENHPHYGKRGKNAVGWKGYEELSGRYWNRVLRGAKERNLEVSITIEDAYEKFLKQNKKCALSGVNLILPFRGKMFYEGNASLDRIDSSKGYTKSNIQWLEKKINIMKMDLKQEDFIRLCEDICFYTKGLAGKQSI
jgi:hypothetical protein